MHHALSARRVCAPAPSQKFPNVPAAFAIALVVAAASTDGIAAESGALRSKLEQLAISSCKKQIIAAAEDQISRSESKGKGFVIVPGTFLGLPNVAIVIWDGSGPDNGRLPFAVPKDDDEPSKETGDYAVVSDEDLRYALRSSAPLIGRCAIRYTYRFRRMETCEQFATEVRRDGWNEISVGAMVWTHADDPATSHYNQRMLVKQIVAPNPICVISRTGLFLRSR